MPRNADATRKCIVEAAYRCLYREGFFRTSVDAVAALAKVTKKTIYYHFASKDDLVAAVLVDQQHQALRMIEKSIASDAVDAVALIRAMFAAYARWSSGPHWFGSGFTRLAMELAELPGHPARVAARHHKRAVEDLVAASLAARGVTDPAKLARRVVLLLEGANTLALVHGDTRYVEEAGDAAAALVAGDMSRGEAARKKGAGRPRALAGGKGRAA